jgi:GNAT superfamily N-acetyltransferase
VTVPPPGLIVRPVAPGDFPQWLPLWDAYNAFYGRSGPTALPAEITRTTWARFLDGGEPVHALVAESGGRLVGLAHYLFHRSTTRIELTCYLRDLYTVPELRGRGIGRALIVAAGERARQSGAGNLYWQTHESNHTARRLYDSLARHAGFIVYEMPI